MSISIKILQENDEYVSWQYQDDKLKLNKVFFLYKNSDRIETMDINKRVWVFTKKYRHGSQYIYQFQNEKKIRKINMDKDLFVKLQEMINRNLSFPAGF